MGLALTDATIETYGCLQDWVDFAARENASLAAEAQSLQALKSGLPKEGLQGHCPVCDAHRRFLPPEGGIDATLSFRESLHCETCRSISRHRAAIAVLEQSLGSRMRDADVYLTEQATTLFVALHKRLRRLVGSEFVREFGKRQLLTAWLLSQGCRSVVRYQDVTALTFRKASRDAVVSFDVLEHVPDYRQALREFARVLRPGGTLVMTVPFYVGSASTDTIAYVRADGSVETYGEPEYHGDPVSNGVLCFHHLGWDLLAAMRDAGFHEAEALRVADAEIGVPEPLWLFRARR